MLLAIKEGIIAVNKEGAVTMMNLSAADMLNLPEPMIGRHIKKSCRAQSSCRCWQGRNTAERGGACRR